MQILLGCGHSRDKRLGLEVDPTWTDLVTLDINPDCHPDKEWDLSKIPLPFPDNSADEIHAYDVLEHTGQQGDYKFFFDQFSDFWRVLKPNGYLFATVPSALSIWTWGDPGHTRIINSGTLSFLEQKSYDLGETKRTDYRNIYKADFKLIYHKIKANEVYEFVLKALKPIGASEGCHPQPGKNESLSA